MSVIFQSVSSILLDDELFSAFCRSLKSSKYYRCCLEPRWHLEADCVTLSLSARAVAAAADSDLQTDRLSVKAANTKTTSVKAVSVKAAAAAAGGADSDVEADSEVGWITIHDQIFGIVYNDTDSTWHITQCKRQSGSQQGPGPRPDTMPSASNADCKRHSACDTRLSNRAGSKLTVNALPLIALQSQTPTHLIFKCIQSIVEHNITMASLSHIVSDVTATATDTMGDGAKRALLSWSPRLLSRRLGWSEHSCSKGTSTSLSAVLKDMRQLSKLCRGSAGFNVLVSLFASSGMAARSIHHMHPLPAFLKASRIPDMLTHSTVVYSRLLKQYNESISSDSSSSSTADRESEYHSTSELESDCAITLAWLARSPFAWKVVSRSATPHLIPTDIHDAITAKATRPYWIIDMSTVPDPTFEHMCETHGSVYAYHGSKLSNWYSIVHNGLQNMSGTKHMSSGAIYGRGAYFATELNVSRMFTQGAQYSGWSGAQHVGMPEYLEVVGCYQIALNPMHVKKRIEETKMAPTKRSGGKHKSRTHDSVPQKYIVCDDTKYVKLKYLLVWKGDSRQVRKKLNRSSSCVLCAYIILIAALILSQMQWKRLRLYLPI
jgi:poly [ADP-ribose] polymerase 16